MTVVSGKSSGTVIFTPSGIPVYFQSGDPKHPDKRMRKRQYRIGDPALVTPDTPDHVAVAHAQTDDSWIDIASVTEVLEVLDKPALPWWGMGVGAEGVSILHNLGLVKSTVLPGGVQPVLICPTVVKPDKRKGEKFAPYIDMSRWIVAGKDQLVDMLNVQKLTTNHVKEKAGERGQSVHDAFETWAKGGGPPDPEMYPPTEQGYIFGFLAFLSDVPSIQTEGTEVLVASREYGFAGRYDWRGFTTEPHRVVFHHTPVKGPQYRILQPGKGIIDLKTSKDVYPNSHFRQLEAYEKGGVESGYGETDWRAILHVDADGNYKLVRSTATFEDFRLVLDIHVSNERIKRAEQEERKRK